MNGIKSSKAITLIALVVTIVVLLILAGISIQMLKGDNGIVTKTNEAKLESRAGNVDEEVKMWKNNNKMIKTQNEVTGESEALVSKEEMLEKLIQEGIVYEKEIDRDKEIITIGTREIPYGEEVDKRALIILVNSGDTGEVKLPVLETEEGITIDWGDDKVTTAENKNTEGKKYANIVQNDSTKNKSAKRPPQQIEHTYPEINKDYKVTITGKCTKLYNGYENDNILEIIQWGETGLEDVKLARCINLRKIASPTEKSFEKITDFSYGFTVCEKLTSIPEDLFANCPNVTTFEGTFAGCTSLTSIPSTLFENCLYVTNFGGTFYKCIGLTGEPIKLWKRVLNGSTNNYIGKPDGYGCYYNATGLNNYENIPEYWREESLE